MNALRNQNKFQVVYQEIKGKREYSWLHPREHFSQESEFNLGNSGL